MRCARAPFGYRCANSHPSASGASSTVQVSTCPMIRRARVLLALDTSVGVVDEKEVIAARLGGVSGETLRLVANRFAETGRDVEATIGRKQRDLPPVPSGDHW